ncbi:hypothetical protein DSECCO2_605480 [anaerobic digester metagenome]
MKNEIKAVIVITPSPPTCMSITIIVLPKTVQWEAVLTTTSPVTQTADVAVKRALTKPTLLPFCEATGNVRRIAPIKMIVVNPRKKTM